MSDELAGLDFAPTCDLICGPDGKRCGSTAIWDVRTRCLHCGEYMVILLCAEHETVFSLSRERGAFEGKVIIESIARMVP